MTRRRAVLHVPHDGPCEGHPCDGCDRCLAGDCCGADVGEAGLPLQGSWPFEWHGTLGVLGQRGDLLVCACCGEAHADLSKHVRVHGLTADAYRATWGLNSTTGLVCERLRLVKSELGRKHGHRLNDGDWQRPTSEQRSRWATDREARAETIISRGQQPRASTGKWEPATPGSKIVARRIVITARVPKIDP